MLDNLRSFLGSFSEHFPSLQRLVLDRKFVDSPYDQSTNLRVMRTVFDKPRLELGYTR